MIRAPAANTARTTALWRCPRLSRAVAEMKIGAAPTGSMITVSVTKVVPIVSQCKGSVAVVGEVHVVLRAAAPAAAPAPADRVEGPQHAPGDHPRTVA